MRHEIPRMRMFAGPNGSGKSTIKSVINSKLLGIYINPDEIEKEIAEFDFFDIEQYGITTTNEEILDFFEKSKLLEKADLLDEVMKLSYNDGKLSFFNVCVNSYYASVAADFVRQKLLEIRVSFTFETVMSSADKIDLLKLAQKLGYKTYLYYVATEDPIINISRVSNRVLFGGHPVPEDKIISRYYRSLSLLPEALKNSTRAYVFDNSNHKHIWLCELTQDKKLLMKTDDIPAWFTEFLLKTNNK